MAVRKRKVLDIPRGRVCVLFVVSFDTGFEKACEQAGKGRGKSELNESVACSPMFFTITKRELVPRLTLN